MIQFISQKHLSNILATKIQTRIRNHEKHIHTKIGTIFVELFLPQFCLSLDFFYSFLCPLFFVCSFRLKLQFFMNLYRQVYILFLFFIIFIGSADVRGEDRKRLIRELGRKPSEEKVSLYVRKPSNETEEPEQTEQKTPATVSGSAKKFMDSMARR